QGTRSWGPLRATHFALENDDYMARANDNILVVLILETREAVDNLESIAAVPGVDVINLGPADLSLAYGYNFLTGPHPPVTAAIERVLAVCPPRGVACGNGSTSGDEVRQLRER